MKPLIGLPGRRKKGRQIAGFAASWADVDVEVHIRDYSRHVAAAGGLPVTIPVDCDPMAIVERLDGLVLTGGADIDPARYGAARSADLGDVEPDRDQLEIALLEAALAADVPVLGICRGHQLINVAFGGTLHQHDPTHARFDLPIDAADHAVTVCPGTRLGAIYGADAKVNSLHHQHVDRLGDGLVVSACATDGTVEGIEIPGRDVVGVQWHPELLADSGLFAWLIEQASRRLARR